MRSDTWPRWRRGMTSRCIRRIDFATGALPLFFSLENTGALPFLFGCFSILDHRKWSTSVASTFNKWTHSLAYFSPHGHGWQLLRSRLPHEKYCYGWLHRKLLGPYRLQSALNCSTLWEKTAGSQLSISHEQHVWTRRSAWLQPSMCTFSWLGYPWHGRDFLDWWKLLQFVAMWSKGAVRISKQLCFWWPPRTDEIFLWSEFGAFGHYRAQTRKHPQRRNNKNKQFS